MLVKGATGRKDASHHQSIDVYALLTSICGTIEHFTVSYKYASQSQPAANETVEQSSGTTNTVKSLI